MTLIKLKHPDTGETRHVSKSDYVTAKTKMLIEFGYTNLTEAEVETQLNNLLDGKELDIIGMFIEKDIEL